MKQMIKKFELPIYLSEATDKTKKSGYRIQI